MGMTMTTTRDSVWQASAEYLRRQFKWVLYQDSGQMELSPGLLRFQGQRRSVIIANIRAVSLERQTIPWLNIAVAIGLPFGALYLGVFNNFHWGDPLSVGVVAAISVFYFVSAGPVMWIRVDYEDDVGNGGQAYFLAGGFSRFLGGTRRLYEEIKATVFQPRS